MEHTLGNTIKNQQVKADDLVEVTGTGKNEFLKDGEKHIVHRILGEELSGRGFVTIGDAQRNPKADKKGNKL